MEDAEIGRLIKEYDYINRCLDELFSEARGVSKLLRQLATALEDRPANVTFDLECSGDPPSFERSNFPSAIVNVERLRELCAKIKLALANKDRLSKDRQAVDAFLAKFQQEKRDRRLGQTDLKSPQAVSANP